MMRTILVPLTAGLAGEPVLDAALVLARRVKGHIRALFILPDPHAVLAFLPDVILAAGVTREVIERETQEAAAEEKERFIDWRTRNNVPEAADGRVDTCFATWAEQIGEFEAVVTRWGRLSDLIVVPRPAWAPSRRGVTSTLRFSAADARRWSSVTRRISTWQTAL